MAELRINSISPTASYETYAAGQYTVEYPSSLISSLSASATGGTLPSNTLYECYPTYLDSAGKESPFGQFSYVLTGTGSNTYSINWNTGGKPGINYFASLAGLKYPGTSISVPNGTQTFCPDCTVTTPASCLNSATVSACTCVGSGTGAQAKLLNGVWLCN